MFESDEFDVDEDFLKDVDEKVEEYFSQRNESDNEPSPKRQKLENQQTDLSDINFDDEPDFVRNAGKIIEDKSEISSSISSSIDEKMPNNEQENSVATSDETNIEERRNLALEILRRGATEKNSGTTIFSRKSLKNERNSENSNEPLKNFTNVDTFKKPIPRWSKSTTKTISRETKKYISSPQSRMTLVRKFPGPAGLLPDSPDLDANNAIFFKRLEENNIETRDNIDDSNISEYCSQNTERMFSVGAWRTMLDDLPKDFLKGHDIATIKRLARNNGGNWENSRAPFLAGVVQRIDHSRENPRLVLKDLGDSIEATMHRDISLAHPDVIEPGVVLLLRDAGLLGFQGSQQRIGHQFHVIISPKNLLAVYTEKSRLITNPWMKSLLGDEIKNSNNKIVSFNIENDYDDAFATVDIGAISDSQIAESFSDVTPNIEKNENKKLSKINDELSNNRKIINTYDNIKEKIEIRPKRITSVKLKLMKYRNDDVLTPPIADIDNSMENISRQISNDDDITNIGTFADNLLDSDNDTEDEILSQLDVDSIVTNYNSRTFE